jgi:thymidylate synthase (FAD)
MNHVTAEQKKEIDEIVNEQALTSRFTSVGLESILYQPIPVLDHGFIRVVDYMGTDQSIVQAARVSYGRGTRKTSEDEALINYLIRHSHTTPFEMAEIKLHVKLPIFVARQWIRHRTANVNEYSARYSILDKEFYLPSHNNIGTQDSTNRQGRGSAVEQAEGEEFVSMLRAASEQAHEFYRRSLNENEEGQPKSNKKRGIARELARIGLPLNYYTQWYWKIDLHNLMGFLRLRSDKHAQLEIRMYADAILEVLEKWVPLTFKAFSEHVLGGARLSATAVAFLRKQLAGQAFQRSDSKLSVREWNELAETFGFRSSSSNSLR